MQAALSSALALMSLLPRKREDKQIKLLRISQLYLLTRNSLLHSDFVTWPVSCASNSYLDCSLDFSIWVFQGTSDARLVDGDFKNKRLLQQKFLWVASGERHWLGLLPSYTFVSGRKMNLVHLCCCTSIAIL